MWRWIRRIFLGLIVLLVALATVGFVYQRIADRRDRARTPPPGSLVDVGGHRLHIVCEGSGSPTVILDAGLGSSSFGWGTFPGELGTFTRVCAYDRAGLGYSDPGPSPRTSERIAAELSELLRATRTAPAIAVGASVGGLHMRVLASKHREDVAGLVLVDASHEDQGVTTPPFARLVPLAGRLGLLRLFGLGIGRDYPSRAFLALRFNALFEELTGIPDSNRQVKASRRKLQIPVVVITAGLGTDDRWRAFQRDQAALAERSCQMVAENSGHAIAVGQPEAIVRGIRAAWEAARSNSTPNCTTR